MKQLVDFNPSNGGTKKYWCLRNVRMGYGIGSKYASAWDAWQNSPQFTSAIPKGVDVPVYFSFVATLNGVRRNWGHIAVQMADGRVWTDGRWYASVKSLERNYLANGKYVGWSTHVNGVQVIKQGGSNILEAQIKRLEEKVENRNKLILKLEEEKANRDLVIKRLNAEVEELEDDLAAAQEAYKQLEKEHAEDINDLKKVIKIKDNEIARLNKELESCGTDCDKLTGWELIALGIKKTLGRSK